MKLSSHFHFSIKRVLTAVVFLSLFAMEATSKPALLPLQGGPKRKMQVNKPTAQNPEIKQVPKARRQVKPAVVKPNVKMKVKPIKIIRPKFKRP
jgi:hypothetical protein